MSESKSTTIDPEIRRKYYEFARSHLDLLCSTETQRREMIQALEQYELRVLSGLR